MLLLHNIAQVPLSSLYEIMRFVQFTRDFLKVPLKGRGDKTRNTISNFELLVFNC